MTPTSTSDRSPSRSGSNRLAGEASPYLLQHAHNPVDWYPWGAEALDRARREDRPILLSIGYAACHWCHVMERESFEDPGTAALMNEHFVSIKVDREERPDLDAIYMDAVQAMTGAGGWPMTVFLTPQGEPFYAGTYFPKEERAGLPAFGRVLTALAEVWRDQRDRAVEQARRIVGAISARAGGESAEPLAEGILREAFDGLRQAFDSEWGGFGGAPKFPQPMTLEFLLRCHLRGYQGALEMVETTLQRMARGGVFDQVGGGFHRYSTDRYWHVPHFEKMLYDNAQLTRLYARAWQITGRREHRAAATRTGRYLLREMRHPEGGFYSSQDADSDGREGAFFVWDWDDLASTVEEPIARFLGAGREGNWEGTNVLWIRGPAPEDGGPSPEALQAALDRLFALREARVRPATDDKVLAAWNGLAISALAEAGRILGQPEFVAAAVRAADFVLTRMRRANGRLLRSWRDGRAGGPGYLDDHANMADACLTLYQTTFDPRFFHEARALADNMVRLFRDGDGGGFFQTGLDAEALIIRPKELFDNAVPSGNSMAAEVLLRLALLTGEARYQREGASALRAVRDHMGGAPSGFGHALCALDLYLSKAKEVAVVGDPAAADTRALLRVIQGPFRPNAVLAVAGPGDARAPDVVPLLRDRTPLDGRATAYVCEGFACRRPVTDPGELAAQLEG
jgi:uncharacterized protein YyaL (SSP411 family)